MTEDYLKKVSALAWVMYELDADILEEYESEIQECYEHNFTPRRTVEVIANILFG